MKRTTRTIYQHGRHADFTSAPVGFLDSPRSAFAGLTRAGWWLYEKQRRGRGIRSRGWATTMDEVVAWIVWGETP